MNSKLFLRIAAVVMLLHCAGHTLGIATWQDSNGKIPTEVVQIMQYVQFSFMGKNGSTMAEFYSGFGYIGTVFMLFIVILLWQLSCWKDKSVVPILGITATAIALLTIIEIVYFFPMAVVFCFTTSLFVFLAISKINKMETK